MDITRRRLLSFVPATALLTAVNPAPSARAATLKTMADPSQLLANAIAIYAGTAESNARPEVAAKLAALDSTARTWLAASTAPAPASSSPASPSGPAIRICSASYQHLYEIALATKRPGPASDLQGNEQVRARVAEKLVWLHENYYGDQSKGYYGNWFTWEIGISTYVSKTLALLDAPAAT